MRNDGELEPHDWMCLGAFFAIALMAILVGGR